MIFFLLSHVSPSKRLFPGTAVWETLEKICTLIVELLSHVWLFVTPQTIALQAPLSVGFPRQEYWSGLPCPPPEKICATQMLMYVKHIPEGTQSPAGWADLLNFPTELHRLPPSEQWKWLSVLLQYYYYSLFIRNLPWVSDTKYFTYFIFFPVSFLWI